MRTSSLTENRIIVRGDQSVASPLTHTPFFSGERSHWGRHSINCCFQVPLRGREHESKWLLEAVERISTSSSSEFIQITGASGSGKTKLIKETLQPQNKWWFVSSKFEELQQRIPFCAVTSAFSDLLDLVVQSDKVVVDTIRDHLQRKLSTREQTLLGGLFSTFQHLIGTLDHLGYEEADALYTHGEDVAFDQLKKSFRTLLKVIADVYPVVILWDDLHWADPTTVALLDSLLAQGALRAGGDLDNTLFIGTCCDGAATCAPQLEELFTSTLSLDNLSSDAILQVVSDLTLLPADDEMAKTLRDIVHAKTAGHPYFAVAFIEMLKENGLLRQNDNSNDLRWIYDDNAQAIRQQTDVSPNIVELLDAKIKTRLTSKTRDLLAVAAHIGFRFDEQLLVAVVDQSAYEVTQILATAQREGCIEATSSSEAEEFKFSHDRIHAALYQGDHPKIHLQIARTIEPQFNADSSLVFAYAEHLNRASTLLNKKEDRIQVAKANLEASKAARGKHAIFAAADYLHEGLNAIDQDIMWREENEDTTNYKLALELTASSALINYYCGDFVTCKQQIQDVMENARCEADKLQVFEILVEVKGADMEFEDAIKTGIKLIRQLGHNFPSKPNFPLLLWVFFKTKRLVGNMTDDELFALPDLDPENQTISVIIRILGTLCMYGIWTHNFPLIAIGSMHMMQLTLKHGQSDLSPYALCMYGATLIVIPGFREEAFRFAHLALRMLARYPSTGSEARTLMVTYTCILHHVEPLQTVSEAFEQACISGLSTGDIENGLTGAAMQASADLSSGKDCVIVAAELRALCEQVSREIKHENLLRIVRLFWQMAENLMGMVDDPITLTGDAMDESAMMVEASDNVLLLQYCRLCRLQLCVYFGNFYDCPTLIDRITKDEFTFTPTFNYYFFKFFSALAYASIARGNRGRKYLKAFRKCRKQLLLFDTQGTVNVPPLMKLLEAENMVLTAKKGSEQSIERAFLDARATAGKMKFCNIEALCCERYASVLQERGDKEKSRQFTDAACLKYGEFGAEAKVEQLA